MLDDFDLKEIVKPLQGWFGQAARVLPWRENPLPYYVWVSEVMLQQTRVEAVMPYFERFIRELPDVHALAACPEDKLLKLWEGLGYYNRARNLKAAARQVEQSYGGRIPDSYENLLELKGIGHYTAGAIASIAYGKPCPAVDGNVLRVISRLTGDGSDIMKQSVRTHMEDKLRELMASEKAGVIPGIFNQALMELGAIVCVPNRAPRCEVCPCKGICVGRRLGIAEDLPAKSKAKMRKIEKRTVFIVRDGEKVAIRKRSGSGLLAGMYELPNCPGQLGKEEALSYVEEMGYLPMGIRPLEAAKHVFSHVEWQMTGYAVSIASPEAQREGGQPDWIFVEAGDARERYAIPAAFAKYAAYMSIEIGIQ